MTRTLMAIVLALHVAVGAVAGAALARRRPPPAADDAPRVASTATKAAPRQDPDLEPLRRRVSDLEALAAAAEPAPEPAAARARRICRLRLAKDPSGEAEDRFGWLLEFARLDESMTAPLIEELGTDPSWERRAAIVPLILEAGGPEASAWLRRLAESGEIRGTLKDALQLLWKRPSPFRFERFKVDARLFESARKLASLPDKSDRMSSLSLFAHRDADDSREFLQTMAESDLEPDLRWMAVLTLCRIAKPATREWFDRWSATLPADDKEVSDVLLRKARDEMERRLGK